MTHEEREAQASAFHEANSNCFTEFESFDSGWKAGVEYARRTVTDEQRKKAAKALVETYLGFPAPDREPCDLDLKAVDAVHAILAAGASDSAKEPK